MKGKEVSSKATIGENKTISLLYQVQIVQYMNLFCDPKRPENWASRGPGKAEKLQRKSTGKLSPHSMKTCLPLLSLNGFCRVFKFSSFRRTFLLSAIIPFSRKCSLGLREVCCQFPSCPWFYLTNQPLPREHSVCLTSPGFSQRPQMRRILKLTEL